MPPPSPCTSLEPWHLGWGCRDEQHLARSGQGRRRPTLRPAPAPRTAHRPPPRPAPTSPAPLLPTPPPCTALESRWLELGCRDGHHLPRAGLGWRRLAARAVPHRSPAPAPLPHPAPTSLAPLPLPPALCTTLEAWWMGMGGRDGQHLLRAGEGVPWVQPHTARRPSHRSAAAAPLSHPQPSITAATLTTLQVPRDMMPGVGWHGSPAPAHGCAGVAVPRSPRPPHRPPPLAPLRGRRPT